MARHNLSWRIAITAASVLCILASNSSVAFGQYTFVQDTDSVGFWDELFNWDTDNNPGTPNTTYPNGVGVTAQINQPIWNNFGPYTLEMPTTDVTLGQLTIDHTNDDYGTRIVMEGNGGRLIFEDPSGTAKWIETPNTPDAPPNIQYSIQPLIKLNSDLEITHNNYPNLNTGTIFTNRMDGDANRTIIKKGIGGIQFNLNVATLNPGEGFFGQIQIQEGAIRLINKTTFLSTVGGVTVSDGGQLQLADNMGTAVPDYNMASGAVLNLNGDGTDAPSSGPQGALRFGIFAGRTTTFHNPVVLQSDSTIAVGAVNSIGVIDQPVTDNNGGYSLTKHGDGKLVLSHASNSWAGDTTILTAPSTTGSSVLSLSSPSLADGRDVFLSATRTALDLNFTGTDAIRSFFIDSVEQLTGTWGAIGAVALGADHESALITGTGWLNVMGATLAGDYNGDGVVDAADYVAWRKDPNAHGGDPDGYNTWTSNFGAPGSGSGALGTGAVPEPAALTLILCGLLSFAATQRALCTRGAGAVAG